MERCLRREHFSYEGDRAILFNGDVLDRGLLSENNVNLIVTSPPYNVGIEYSSSGDNSSYDEYLEFSESWMKNCYFWAQDECRFLLNIPLDKNKGGAQSILADLTNLAKKVGWSYHSTIVWNEGNISRRTAWGSWLSASAPYVIAPVEMIVVFYKEKWKKMRGSKISDITKDEFMNWTNGLWVFNGESKKRIGHPAPFPRELPRRCIKLFSYVDDVVLDPFCGSGTTMIEAFLNKRKFIGIDLDREYCELARNRFLTTINKERGLI